MRQVRFGEVRRVTDLVDSDGVSYGRERKGKTYSVERSFHIVQSKEYYKW